MANTNNLAKHKRADKIKWIAITIAVLLLAVACTAALTQGFTNANPYGWLDKKAPMDEVGELAVGDVITGFKIQNDFALTNEEVAGLYQAGPEESYLILATSSGSSDNFEHADSAVAVAVANFGDDNYCLMIIVGNADDYVEYFYNPADDFKFEGGNVICHGWNVLDYADEQITQFDGTTIDFGAENIVAEVNDYDVFNQFLVAIHQA